MQLLFEAFFEIINIFYSASFEVNLLSHFSVCQHSPLLPIRAGLPTFGTQAFFPLYLIFRGVIFTICQGCHIFDHI